MNENIKDAADFSAASFFTAKSEHKYDCNIVSFSLQKAEKHESFAYFAQIREILYCFLNNISPILKHRKTSSEKTVQNSDRRVYI